jgi:hypothetical protein
MKVTFVGLRKGQRGRGAAGKVPVFGLLKRGGKVYAVVIADAKATTLLPILKERIVPDSIVYSVHCPATMRWIWLASGSCGSIMPGCLPTVKTTSMASRTFGIRPNATCANLTVFPKNISRYS